MKRYVWMAVTLAAITGANASDNPFDLNENLKKLEIDQEVLLKDIKKEAATLEAIHEAADDAEINAEDEEETAPVQAVSQKEVIETSKASPKSVNVQEGALSGNDKEKSMATKEKRKETPTEVVKLEKIKEDQAKLDAEREAEMKAKAEAQRKAQAEKAKQEQEALEKLKAEREAAEKRAQESELARQKAEKERLEKEAQTKASEIVTAKTGVSESAESTVASDDINITREELEAKRKADEELQKAIAEVDQED